MVGAAGLPQAQSTVKMTVPESLGCFAHSPIAAVDAEFPADTLRYNARWLRARSLATSHDRHNMSSAHSTTSLFSLLQPSHFFCLFPLVAIPTVVVSDNGS